MVMLEKKAGVILVSKLWAILLMEADFNFTNKELYRRCMMAFVEEHNQIPAECYGSCKHHEAINIALNWHLIGDIFWQKWVSRAAASVDLTNCYDRMAHDITSLSCQCWGVPPEPLVSMLSTLQSMVFFLWMAHGDSMDSYGSTAMTHESLSPHPFQGICQGNGGGPAASLGVNAPCVQLLQCHGHIATFQHSLSGWTLNIVGLIYVDNTDLVEIAHTPQETMAMVGPCKHYAGMEVRASDRQCTEDEQMFLDSGQICLG